MTTSLSDQATAHDAAALILDAALFYLRSLATAVDEASTVNNRHEHNVLERISWLEAALRDARNGNLGRSRDLLAQADGEW